MIFASAYAVIYAVHARCAIAEHHGVAATACVCIPLPAPDTSRCAKPAGTGSTFRNNRFTRL